MVLFTLCIVDPVNPDGITAPTFTIPDFNRRTLINLCIEMGQEGLLDSIAKTELPSQLYSYIRGLHTKSSIQHENSCGSSTSAPEIKGGKTFVSIMKPVIVFVRYATKKSEGEMLDDLYLLLAIEASARASSLSQQMMSIPKVANRAKALRSAKGATLMGLIEHEFDQATLDALALKRD